MDIHYDPKLIDQLNKIESNSQSNLKELKQLEILEMETGRRYIKSHLPLSLLPPDLPKIASKVRKNKECKRLI